MGQKTKKRQIKQNGQKRQTEQMDKQRRARQKEKQRRVEQQEKQRRAEQKEKARQIEKKVKARQAQQREKQHQAQQEEKARQTQQKEILRQEETLRQEERMKRQAGEWKEFLYNCPYLIAVVCTSLLVMVLSDEIGFKAVAKEAQTTVQQTMGRGITTAEPSSDLTENSDMSGGLENVDGQEKAGENAGSAEENAGTCKENSVDPADGSGQTGNSGIDKNSDGTDKNEESLKGITNFEEYEPQAIESRYYSDAGKVALTTEYPYTKENISYFNDAAFLGDSRTLGISDYAGLDEADFYCDSGMMIFKLLEEKVTYQKTGEKVELAQVLQEKKYGKIYIMLGMNELGYGNTPMYLEEYRTVLEQIRQWQPEAIIYVMANLHVSEEKNNMETEFNNININDKNAASALLANGTDIFYLDANPLFTDENGFLKAELTFDGVHLYAQHYDLWREFLLEHAVERTLESDVANTEPVVE